MLLTTPTSLLASALLLSAPALAAPTRTHCRCTVVVADPAPAAIFTPSAAHWTPAEPSSSPLAFADPCANLGPELENFQHTEPDLYASYLAGSVRPASSDDDDNERQRPISRAVVTKFASAKGRGLKARRKAETEGMPRPTSRRTQRIVCHSEADQFSEYQGSFVTLWFLHVIVAVVILACIAEGVHLSLLRWYGRSDSTEQNVVRLPGSQNLLLEISSEGMSAVEIEGGEKKGWTQQATPMLIVQAPNGDRVCIKYEEDFDDEMYRPVM